ncbi:MAG: hypothetical protein J2P13_04085 [Acidobacteria bacterium]|nr:hypothetical protein [Acidobacteriota bacterium]
MQIGAIVTVSDPERNQTASSPFPRELARSDGFLRTDKTTRLLGHNLVDLVMAKIDRAGGGRPSILREEPGPAGFPLPRPASSEDFVLAWEEAVASWISQQAELLLLVRAGTYMELEFAELIRFHRERGAPVTEAYTKDGPLDVAIVSAAALRGDGSSSKALSKLIGCEQRFYYSGYVNRLRTPRDFMQLVDDGLNRRSELRPAGAEQAQGIWLGEGADVDPTCVIEGPAFVGSLTRVNSCCTVKPGSAIESGCDIDSGTTVDGSWILPETYVGVGLNVRRSIVSNRKMFHLDRQTEVTILDRRLIGARRGSALFGFEKDC